MFGALALIVGLALVGGLVLGLMGFLQSAFKAAQTTSAGRRRRVLNLRLKAPHWHNRHDRQEPVAPVCVRLLPLAVLVVPRASSAFWVQELQACPPAPRAPCSSSSRPVNLKSASHGALVGESPRFAVAGSTLL
jgi:hypothetical protein